MFSLLGVSPAAVDALRDTAPHLHDWRDSRMNLAGIMPHNVAYVARGDRRGALRVIGRRRRRQAPSASLNAPTSVAESFITLA